MTVGSQSILFNNNINQLFLKRLFPRTEQRQEGSCFEERLERDMGWAWRLGAGQVTATECEVICISELPSFERQDVDFFH